MYVRWFAIVLFILAGCVVQKQPAFDTVKLTLVEHHPDRAGQIVEKPKSEDTIPQKPEAGEKPEVPAVVQETAEKTTPSTAEKVPASAPEDSIPTIAEIPKKITNAVRLKKGEYTIENRSLEIAEGAELWIEAGTIFDIDSYGIICYGSMHAIGTGDEPIVFRGADEWENVTVWGEHAVGNFQYCQFFDGYGKQVEIRKDGDHRLQEGGRFSSMGGALLYGNGSKGRVENCRISDNYGKGAIALLSVTEVTVADNEISGNDQDGIDCIAGAPTIRGNKIRDNRQNGILCSGASKATIADNLCEGNKMAGIVVQNEACPSISKNKCENNDVGMIIRDTAAPHVSENELSANKKIGIVCSGESSPLIEKNRVEKGRVAIFSAEKSHPTIQSNTCWKQTEACLVFVEQSQAKAEGNSLKDTPTGILIQVPLKATIKNNSITGCGKPQEEVKLKPQGR